LSPPCPRLGLKFGMLPPPPPPPPASPVIKATTASRAHNPKRNGRNSNCFVRARAGEMDSIAEARFGTQHLPGQSLYFYLPTFSNKCLGNLVPWKRPCQRSSCRGARQTLSLGGSGSLFDASSKNCPLSHLLSTCSSSATLAACAAPSPVFVCTARRGSTAKQVLAP
jgi:hypothetical protein